jgi:hypothetical protein
LAAKVVSLQNRKAIDLALDKISGIPPTPPSKEDEEEEEWQKWE